MHIPIPVPHSSNAALMLPAGHGPGYAEGDIGIDRILAAVILAFVAQ
jgi:hypothetical protein